MNQKQMKEFMKALNAIAEEKKIDKSIVVEAMEQAMAAAYKKNEGLTNVMAKVDDVTGDIRIYSYKTVVETVENPDLEISLEDASKEVEGIELGDTIKDKELPLKDFGRVAAQTAKQIVVQRVKEAQGNFDLTQVLGNKYLEDVDSEKCVIVDTYSNRCFLISKDLLHHGVSEEVYHKMLDSDETDSNKSSEEVTFILTITYKCNMHCTYCYQQNDKTLEKKLISDETLDKILSIIAQYMEANPNKTVRLGLFGGEPLLIENEKVIDKILQFCKEHKTTVHITTNGSFLSYYLKKFIINRRFISGIYPTIDSMALNYMTRYDLDPSRNNTNETFKLLCCIKTLLHYGIHVDLGTNIDRHNHKEIWNTLDDLKKLQLLQDKNFAWTIGRVDDRLYETNFPDIMMESEILAELQSKPLPDNVHAAFLKTCYNFADKMGLKLNLREHKQTHSYCWSTSSSSNVFYVDMNLKTYRCTCTVGRSRYSLFDFSYENLTNYRPVAVTCNSYAECKDCKIGGFCGGGCQLSHQIDFKKCCTYEEEVFSHFMKTLFIPYIKSKYNEVNQNERKAENRCT